MLTRVLFTAGRKKIMFLLQCSKNGLPTKKERLSSPDRSPGLAGDLTGERVAKICAVVAKIGIVGDISRELAGELSGNLAGDPLANIFCNGGKIIKLL
jgi:hypothetical protein